MDTNLRGMLSHQLTLRLYRALLRASNFDSACLNLRLPVNANDIGRVSHVSGDSYNYRLIQYLGDLHQSVGSQFTSGESQTLVPSRICSFGFNELRDLIRSSFRNPSLPATCKNQDLGFQALRLMNEQTIIAASTSESLEEGMHVEVSSCFKGLKRLAEGEAVADFQGAFSFAYRVTIRNFSSRTVQVRGRCWQLELPDGQTRGKVLKGSPASAGVVGRTPILQPGDVFEYTSCLDATSARGCSISGSLQMVSLIAANQADTFFDVIVPPFALIATDRQLENAAYEN